MSACSAVSALLTAQVCDAVVTVPTLEWDALGGGPRQLAAWLAAKVQEAMVRVVAGEQQQHEQYGHPPRQRL